MSDEQNQALEQSGQYNLPQREDLTVQKSFDLALYYILKNQPIILYGPPGTGKTKLVYDIKQKLEEDDKIGKFENVQFHKKFTYEDFVEGFSPNATGSFEKKDGIFKNFCKNPSDKPVDLFLIDEINRAEITTTFGELLFLIEDRKLRSVQTSHFNDKFTMPPNLSLVGTMNTADRNIAILDFALRRRFVFIPVFPDYNVLLKLISEFGFTFESFTPDQYVKAVKIINKRISKNRLMGRNMQLGHAMLIPTLQNGAITETDIINMFNYSLLPQLESYCGYGYEDQLATLLNPNVAEKYLNNKQLNFNDIDGLIRDLDNEK